LGKPRNRRKLGHEVVQGPGEAFELAVGHEVEKADRGEELDVAVGQPVGRTSLAVVHCLQLLLVALYEARVEYKFASSDESLVDLLPAHGPQDNINLNGQ